MTSPIDDPDRARTSVYVAPFRPIDGSYSDERALGHGVASALAECLGSLDLQVVELDDASVDNPLQFVTDLAERAGARGPRFVGGTYEVSSSVVVVQLMLGASTWNCDRAGWTHDFHDQLEKIRQWLGIDQSNPSLGAPMNLFEFSVESYALGVVWIAERTPQASDEFLRTLDAAVNALTQHMGSAYAERRTRETALQLVSLQPAASSGSDRLMRLIDRGVRSGLDPAAFTACRGFMQLVLCRTAEALDDFKLLVPGHPLPAWYGIGRTHSMAGHYVDAVEAYRRAMALAPDGAPFYDIVRGSDAAPETGAGTWQGMLLSARGEAELAIGDYPAAERSLKAALTSGAERAVALGFMSHVYRNWGLEVRESDPDRAEELLRRHVDTLEQRFQIVRDSADVVAALDVARLYHDGELESRWSDR